MKRPIATEWKCPSCGELNPMSHSKCRCGESKDSVRKNIQTETNSGTGGGLLAVILTIATIIMLYACLTTILGDHCVAKRMEYPGQYKMYGPGQYEGSSGLTGYRLVIDIICYLILPFLLIAWAYAMNQEDESLLMALGSYVAIMVISYLVMRFYTLPRLLIAGGIMFLIKCFVSNHNGQENRETEQSYYTILEEEKEQEQEPSFEGKMIKYLVYWEMVKKATGHDNMFDQMDEEVQENDCWCLTGESEHEDSNWFDNNDEDEDDGSLF